MSNIGQWIYEKQEKNGFQEDGYGNKITEESKEDKSFALLTELEKKALYRKKIAFIRNKALGEKFNKGLFGDMKNVLFPSDRN